MPSIVRKLLKITALCLGIAMLAVCAMAAFAAINRFELAIVIDGPAEQTVEYGEPYTEPEAQIRLKGSYAFQDGILIPNAYPTVTGAVDSEKLGIYSLSYDAEFFLWRASTRRTVYVVDTECPKIELVKGSEETLLPGESYQEPGFRAVDNHDGDITHKVIRREEAGIISYAVIDSSGNPAYAQREIPYFDPIAPQIQLEGGEDYTITVGHVFQDPGYSASDNVDGDLTDLVIREGDVDWLNPGIYPINYSVTDAFQNETRVTRNVEVQAEPWPETQWPEQKTIYLTFDDGPGPYTRTLLDILDRYGVKATFFVVDSGYGAVMKEIVDRGHSIGIHSVTHDYAEIYASPEAFFSDLLKMQEIIYENTGVRTTLMRFPGGSSNLISRKSCEGIMSTLSWAVRDAGFQYFDWNVDSDDAGSARKAEQVRDNVIRGIEETGTCIVLQHDIHPYSVEAVEEIICWGKKNGFAFRKIEPSTPGFQHDVLN